MTCRASGFLSDDGQPNVSSFFVNDFSDGEASQASLLSTLNLFSGNGDDRGENIPIKYGFTKY